MIGACKLCIGQGSKEAAPKLKDPAVELLTLGHGPLFLEGQPT